MTADDQKWRPSRRLRLLATETAIQDGQIPRPTVGEVGRFWLLFNEVPPDNDDPTLSTIEAEAEPWALRCSSRLLSPHARPRAGGNGRSCCTATGGRQPGTASDRPWAACG